MTEHGRAARLLAQLDSSRHREVASIGELETILDAQLAEARATWPTIELDDDAYLSQLADKLCDRATEPAQRVLASLPAADLYLATACMHGDSTAIAALRDATLPSLRETLAKLGAPQETIDETVQRVLVMVFVGDPGRPQITGYSGRGRLRSWLQSIAVRTARRLMGVMHAAHDDDELDRLANAARDPELEVLRERYRDQVRTAFAAALAGLSDRERNVLRQYHLDGLTIDQLAALYHVNRGTTARWVIAARTAVLEATRDRLQRELGIATAEVDSIIRLVRSQLDVSLHDLS